jgi:hypothetical protein
MALGLRKKSTDAAVVLKYCGPKEISTDAAVVLN